jgi:hypothetical protein
MASKSVTKKQETKVVKKNTGIMKFNSSFETDAGVGFGNADKDAFVIPFLMILQSNSPQLNDNESVYIEEAKAGMFLNTATGHLYDGKLGIDVVPAYYQRRFSEWVPRDLGGGYRGDHDPSDIDTSKLSRDDSGKFILTNGNYLSDTRYHFCIIADPENGPQPVVLSLSSTQIVKSRKWMTQMNAIKLKGERGPFTPPTFSHLYHLTTVSESNDKGAWKGIKVEMKRILGGEEGDEYLYNAAKDFQNQVKSGAAKVQVQDDSSEESDATEKF